MKNHLILFLLFLFASTTFAQSIFSDAGIEQPSFPKKEIKSHTRSTPNTLSFSSTEPFFDDFTKGGQLIDTTKWFLNDTFLHPVQYRHGAINNPTAGVVTFDGLDTKGEAYSSTLGSGHADLLESHYIDLSNYQVADNVILSFYLQAKGVGEAPEANDTFFVYFHKNDGTWQEVFAQNGGGSTNMKAYYLPLDQFEYFHSEFQVRFRNRGSLNSHIDLWHLDYVFMGLNRVLNDSAYNDVAIVGIEKPLISPYTAIPYQHFVGKNLVKPFIVQTHNMKNIPSAPSVDSKMTDPVGGNIFTTGATESKFPLIMAHEVHTDTFTTFTDQTLNPYTASYLLRVSLPPDVDGFTGNNRFYESYRIDSIMAYDDGEAEGSYGIESGPKGFGQKFSINKADSVTAVWISFAPRVYYNPISQQNIYMKDYPFRLKIWNFPHPDSFVLDMTGVKVVYEDSVNSFHRYVLPEPVKVNGDFWVGIEQVDYRPIGVGLDMNYDNKQWINWDSAGVWVSSQIAGTLMIRPELPYIKYEVTTGISANINAEKQAYIFPNPSDNQYIMVYFSQYIENYNLHICDAQGKEVALFSAQNTSENQVFDIGNLPAGVYFVKHEMVGENGVKQVITEKYVRL